MSGRRKRRRLNKADAQSAHARRRVVERFGFPIGEERLEEIAEEIRQGRAKFLYRTSNRVTVWETMIEERPARVVYDKRTKRIVTVIRPEDDCKIEEGVEQ